jgi:hypothetical protein
VEFRCSNNTAFTLASGFAVPSSLIFFAAANVGLSVDDVDAILAAFNSAGASDGFLYLGGSRNAIPTGGNSNQDYLDLISKNWSVTISPAE